MVLPTNFPEGRFDLMLTLPHDPRKALRQKSGNNSALSPGMKTSKRMRFLLSGQRCRPMLAANAQQAWKRFRHHRHASVRDLLNISDFQVVGMLNGGSRHPFILQSGCYGNLRLPNTGYTIHFLRRSKCKETGNLSAKNLKIWDWNWFPARQLWKWVGCEKLRSAARKSPPAIGA